ncbi:uncharacterized protein LOC142231151 [Haematobia irritans]|uniref:uncharacterized protein LOC142231151 n=1 Tax=Haematobia irritans TaxID=7368 RepID=UPI003F4F7B1B
MTMSECEHNKWVDTTILHLHQLQQLNTTHIFVRDSETSLLSSVFNIALSVNAAMQPASDGENLIQTHTNKEQQERARTKFATSLENHLNKMNLNGRDRFVSNTVYRTRKFLKTHKNISILNADKGNVTVAMEKRDYKDRMQKIVGDIMSYQRLNKDPTQGLQKKNNEIVDELFKNNIISESEKRRMKTEIATAPRLYGVPKIHKDNFPLRPICSSVNAPSAAMSKFLVNILKKLTTGSKYNIKDSVQFRNKIKDMTIKHDEKLISFDVVSLFPSVPVDLALRIIEERWDEIEAHTNMTKALFIKTLKFCIIDNRYFKYDDKIYRQKKGLPMGSPASPIIADILMERLLDSCMQKLTIRPKFITKYVDDLFAIVKETEIEKTLTTLNSYHNNIRFTMELEQQQKITIIINTAKNLIQRALTISDQQFQQKNKKKLHDILKYNNFPPNIIKKLIANYKPSSEQTDDNKDPKSYKSLTYIPTISERISKSDIFDTNKYNLAHKSNNTLKNLFTNTKDNIPLSETPNVIYEIPCDGKSKEKCQMIYIGTTKNKLKTRLSGHKSDIKIRNNNSKLQKTALATHCAATNHQPNFDRCEVYYGIFEHLSTMTKGNTKGKPLLTFSGGKTSARTLFVLRAPHLASTSASSFPIIPQCSGTQYRVIQCCSVRT